MKTSKFTEVQILKILSEQTQGKTVNKICREHGISQPPFLNGRATMAEWTFRDSRK